MTQFTEGEWVLAARDDGAWTLGVDRPDGRTKYIIAQRAAWASRAEESLANGRLFLAGPAMFKAMQTFLRNRAMVIEASGTERPLSEDRIHYFVGLQHKLFEQVTAAVAIVENRNGYREGAA